MSFPFCVLLVLMKGLRSTNRSLRGSG